MLNERLHNKVVTLKCRPDTGLGDIKGIVAAVESDDSGRTYLILPSGSKEFMIYTDQLLGVIIHGTIQQVQEELQQRIEEDSELVEEEQFSGSVQDLIQVSEDVEVVEDDNSQASSIVRPGGRPVFDMNDPDVVQALQGQAESNYGHFTIQSLNSSFKKGKNENSKHDTEAPSSD